MDADAARDLVLVVVHEGTAAASQRGRDVTVQQGGAFLASSHDTFLMERTAARVTNYSLLRSDLAPRVFAARKGTGPSCWRKQAHEPTGARA